MKGIWKDILISCLMGLVVPWMILSLASAFTNAELGKEDQTVTEIYRETEPRSSFVIPVGTEQGTRQMDLEEYLTGVVLAEMPASFETEALKAQAVVARTYTLRAFSGKGKHGDFSVCTDSTCCQAYISAEDYIGKGGTGENLEKVRRAVYETSGLVLTYEGDLIEATYFSCSGGRTEDAVAVWGTEVPYLQSVESPGEESASHYRDAVTVTKEELETKLSVELQGKEEEWFGEPTRSEGGGVLEMKIGGKVYQGTQLRKLLGLPSAAFSVEVKDGEIFFHTRGYGHRVGMSQYGADAMALQGKDFREILAHYYPGTVLQNMEN